MSTYHAQQTWRANRPKTVVSNDLENPHFPYFYTSKSRFAYLQISLLPHFHTSTLPHYQVKTNVSKVKTYLHISRFAHFHTSTFPHFHISTLQHFCTSTLSDFPLTSTERNTVKYSQQIAKKVTWSRALTWVA